MFPCASAERAAVGAKYLDIVDPGWQRVIDRRRLKMSTQRDCILGQLHGSYDRGMVVLGITAPAVVNMGFSVGIEGDVNPEAIYDELDKAWRYEIAQRCSHEQPPTVIRQPIELPTFQEEEVLVGA